MIRLLSREDRELEQGTQEPPPRPLSSLGTQWLLGDVSTAKHYFLLHILSPHDFSSRMF